MIVEADAERHEATRKLGRSYKFLQTAAKVLFKLLKRLKESDMESSYEIEEKAEKAFNAFERGVVKSEQYLSEAKNLSVSSRKKVDELRDSLNTLRDQLSEDAEGKSDDFYKFQEKHRLIVYGSCAGACVGTYWSMGTICAACYATAATILESKLDEYRAQKDQMLEDVGKIL